MSTSGSRPEQQITELARLVPPPAERDLPEGRRQILKEHLMQEIDGASTATAPAGRRSPDGKRPPERWWRRHARSLIATGAAASIAVAAVIAVAVNLPTAHSGHARHGGAHVHAHAVTAAQLLAEVATAAAAQPAPHVRDSQYEYIESKEAFEATYVIPGQKPRSHMEKPHLRQFWQSVSDLCRPGLLRDPSVGPGDTPLNDNPPNSRCHNKGSLGNPTYRLLQSLPTDPRALLNLIYARTKGQYDEAGDTNRNEKAFETVGDLLRESIAPPQVTAALYRATALIPGVTLVRHATDAIGRPGTGVARTDRSGTRYEWIFDSTTLQMIGERDLSVKTGKVTGTIAILQRAFVDRPGELPPGR